MMARICDDCNGLGYTGEEKSFCDLCDGTGRLD